MADAIFRVRFEQQTWLVARPETGMGYQLLSLSKRGFALVIATIYVVQFRTRPNSSRAFSAFRNY